MRHCDEYIDDKSQPMCLRRYLRFNRWPTIVQVRAWQLGVKEPKLYATVSTPNESHCNKYGVKNGDRVRVVMASRLGDVGITTNLDAENGYKVRVNIEELKDFSDEI